MIGRLFPIGGKASGLVRLSRLGLPVPAFRLWQEDLFSGVLAGRKTEDLDPEDAAALREEIASHPWTPRARRRAQRLFRHMQKHGSCGVAVRSSATDEDSQMDSMAGQLDTRLNVTNEEDLLLAVRSCQASLFSDRACAYRTLRGKSAVDARLTVVLQRQIDAEVSGVLFTRNWDPELPGEMVISSLWGQGEGLVSGSLDSDVFFLDENGNLVEKRIAEKKERFVLDPRGGTRKVGVEDRLQDAPSMSERQVSALARVARRLRKRFGFELDIEFAFASGSMHLLQVRPITPAGSSLSNVVVWDNSNITESYPGITSPLTFTFIRRAYSIVYRQLCEIIGVSDRVIEENSDVFTHMLGHLKGRVYYNLMSWYKVVSFLPGFSMNKAFLEEMMGLTKVRRFIPQQIGSNRRRPVRALFETLSVGVKLTWALTTLEPRVGRFFESFYRNYEPLKNRDWDNVPLEDLLRARTVLEKQFLSNWKPPLLNDLKCMIFFGLLRRLCSQWLGDDISSAELVAGEQGIKSKELVVALNALVSSAQNDEDLRELLTRSEPSDALGVLRDQGLHPRFWRSVESYIRQYGVRGVEEMKLESSTLRDRPEFLLAMVRNALLTRQDDPASHGNGELERRRHVETIVFARVRGLRRIIFSWVLKMAREGVRSRENQRFCRAEIYGVVRDIVRSCGRRLAAQGLLNDAEDVFFLEYEEVMSAFDGTATVDTFAELANTRKKAFSTYSSLSMPDSFTTNGIAYAELGTVSGKNDASPPMTELNGLAASPGTFEGTVHIVHRPDAATRVEGGVLVARHTDPGWVLLFPCVDAIVVEKGSLLSHSAIVAREMGIPAVVGVTDATRLLQNGDVVHVDGGAGTVKLVARSKA